MLGKLDNSGRTRTSRVLLHKRVLHNIGVAEGVHDVPDGHFWSPSHLR